MQVAEFLDQQGLDYKLRGGDQFVVRECPFCNDENWHFYIHRETGLYDCKKCSESGNLYTLRRALNDVDPITPVSELLAVERVAGGVSEDLIREYCKALEQDGITIDWLLARGITKDGARRFRLGLMRDGMKSWLSIPYYKGGKPVNIKFRSLPPQEKAFKVLEGHETPLYNVDILDCKKTVFVTEGELDTVVLVQQGYENVVSVPLGASTFSPEHFDSLVRCGRINLVFDNDSAGHAGMINIADRLGAERCYIVKLPVKDISDF